MADYVAAEILLIAVVVVVVMYLVFPHVKGLHYTSRLTCPKCRQQFDYNWVPGGSFTSARLGYERYLRCPHCGQRSIFDIFSTRTKKNQLQAGEKL
jgi:DNA-directed RNA polymerase subunit RPC12/RpoP